VLKTTWLLKPFAGSNLSNASQKFQRTHHRGQERADDLGAPVRQHLAPREPPSHRQRERDRGVDVRAGDPAGDVDAHDHADAPRPVDGLRSGAERGEHGLCHHADAEDDEGEGAEHFGRQLAGQGVAAQ